MQTTSVENYYDLLGVEKSASLSEIKKAYFTKIREFPNETHPDQFQQLTKAYKILVSSDDRKQYDYNLNDNGKYTRLLNQAVDTMNKDQYHRALTLLEDMLRSYPNDYSIQLNIAICYISLERLEEAKRLLFQLETNHPEDEMILSLLGRTFLNLSMYHQARKYYEKLVKLNSEEQNYYIGLSSSFLNLKEYDQALKILENKLSQKKEKIYDFPLLEELFFITMIADKLTYHKNVIQRIKNLYSTHEEKEQLLNMLIRLCTSIENDNLGFKELVNLVEEINDYDNKEVTEWVLEAESYIRSDLYYYGDPISSQTEYNTSSSNSNQTDFDDENPRGSILYSIIFGIIASFFLSPIGGIIVGVVWYFFASAIKKLISFLGCLVLIVLIVGIIANM